MGEKFGRVCAARKTTGEAPGLKPRNFLDAPIRGTEVPRFHTREDRRKSGAAKIHGKMLGFPTQTAGTHKTRKPGYIQT